MNPEKEDGDTISFKTMHENFNKLVPDPKAVNLRHSLFNFKQKPTRHSLTCYQAAKAKADAEKSAKAELKKQEKVAAEKVGAKAARAEARKSRNAERAVRREQKVEKQNAKVCTASFIHNFSRSFRLATFKLPQLMNTLIR